MSNKKIKSYTKGHILKWHVATIGKAKKDEVDRRHQHPGPKIFLSDERPVQLEMALQDEALD